MCLLFGALVVVYPGDNLLTGLPPSAIGSLSLQNSGFMATYLKEILILGFVLLIRHTLNFGRTVRAAGPMSLVAAAMFVATCLVIVSINNDDETPQGEVPIITLHEL